MIIIIIIIIVIITITITIIIIIIIIIIIVIIIIGRPPLRDLKGVIPVIPGRRQPRGRPHPHPRLAGSDPDFSGST